MREPCREHEAEDVCETCGCARCGHTPKWHDGENDESFSEEDVRCTQCECARYRERCTVPQKAEVPSGPTTLGSESEGKG